MPEFDIDKLLPGESQRTRPRQGGSHYFPAPGSKEPKKKASRKNEETEQERGEE